MVKEAKNKNLSSSNSIVEAAVVEYEIGLLHL